MPSTTPPTTPHTTQLASPARPAKPPRPTITISQSFVLTLDVADLRLVLRALSGRLRPEDISPAHALGEHLSLQRASRTQQITEENEKLLQNLTTR